MFKIVTTLLMFFLVISVGKRLLILQSNKMGGDFNKAIEYVKNGDYVKAVMAFTGESTGVEEENLEFEAFEEAEKLIKENKDKNIFDALQEMFLDIGNDINNVIE